MEGGGSEQQAKLVRYLDELERQMSARRGGGGLEEQLAALSRAYNQAQEKLLDTERALMAESLLLEKQRSVIDIYKAALNDQLDEQGLLYFLQRLEEDETNREIYDDIAQIRNIVSRRHRTLRTEEDRLRKELARATEDRSFLAEQSDKANSSCLEAQVELHQLQGELAAAREEAERKEEELGRVKALLEEERRTTQRLTQQATVTARTIEDHVQREKQLQREAQRMQQVEQLLREKIGWSTGGTGKGKENSSSNLASPSEPAKPWGWVEELSVRLGQLCKYKAQYKRLKEEGVSSEFLKREVAVLKLFLPEEGLQLCRELEAGRQECVEGELRNLALLERARLARLEECERDVWKYRMQLMLEQDDPHPRPALAKSTHSHSTQPTALPVSQFSS